MDTDPPTSHMLSFEVKDGNTVKTNQYIAAVSAAISAIIAGTMLGWTSPALPQLTPLPFTNNTNASVLNVTDNSLVQPSGFMLDTTESSLVSAILAIGALMAALPAGFMAQRLGRRPTILLLSVPLMLTWILTVFANGAAMLITARFFAGVGTGGVCVTAPMYISEIAETSIRGSLGAFFQLFLTIGILFMYVVGAWTSWRILSIISMVWPVLLVVVFWWMPETPQYLLSQNRRRDAEKALRWLRGPDADLTLELEDMQRDINDASRQKGGMLSMLTNRAAVMGLICSLGLMFFQQFSGINAVIFYTNTIFGSAGSNIPSAIATIIVGVVQTIATGGSSLLIEKAGRRILLLQSCVIMGICLVILGTYFKLQADLVDVSSVGWIPLLCMVLFIVSFSLGFGPIPWLITSELFTVEFRSAASSMAVITNWCMVFVVTLCFPLVKDIVGMHYCLWFFAVFMVGCVFFVFFLVPETKGKSISQIQTILARRTDGLTCPPKHGTRMKFFANRAAVMGLICSLGLMFFQQFSGINAVIFYTNTIFGSAGSNIPSAIATIIVGVVQTIATGGSSLLIEKAGRRILLLQSCVIMGICLVILGTYFKLQADLVDVSSVGWIPLLCMVLFIVSFSLGFGPIPWLITSELFTVEFRSAASSMAVITNWCMVFVVTLCFPLVKDIVGMHYCLWFFAVFMVGCVFFVFFLVPETKGKSISQIQTILARRLDTKDSISLSKYIAILCC